MGFILSIIIMLLYVAIIIKEHFDKTDNRMILYILGIGSYAGCILLYFLPSTILWLVLPILILITRKYLLLDKSMTLEIIESLLAAIAVYFLRSYLTVKAPVENVPKFLDVFTCGCIFIQFAMYAYMSEQSIEDITNCMKRTENRANIDPLTELYNRKNMDRYLAKQMSSIKTFSIIMFDIDNFKKVNDVYGHLFGDEVLKKLAKIMKKETEDCAVPFRYGGEEFLIICPEMKKTDARTLAEEIRIKFHAEIFKTDDQELSFSCSAGVADCAYNQYSSAEDLIEACDSALYKAKRTGKNKTLVT